MQEDYYNYVRSEIAPLLPATAQRIVDVGCGNGATSAWLKTLYPAAYAIGLEGNGELRDRLSHNVDELHVVDLNRPLPDIGAPDLVLLLDILEHLVDPLAVLHRLVDAMAKHATVIISLPNVAHLTVAARLFLMGRFDYQDAGILDRTHLRFFYRDSAFALAERAGLEVISCLRSGVEGPGARRSYRLLNRLTAGVLRDRLAVQFIFSARRRQQP